MAWDEAKILKMEANYSKRRTAESFFINQRANEVNVLNRIDGTNMPVVYGMLMNWFSFYFFDGEKKFFW